MFTLIAFMFVCIIAAVLVPILRIIFKIFGFMFKTYVILCIAGIIVLVPLIIIFWLI